MEFEGNKLPHSGKYLSIERPHVLVFSWNQPFSSDETVVSLEFTKVDEQNTNIELSHTKFVDEESKNNHEGGWLCVLNIFTSLYKKL